MVKCKCGSTNCTLVEWNSTAQGAKRGLGGGALAGALIGLAGGPIGAIVGAAVGAAGGAVVGKSQPKDKKNRPINQYKCNSCGTKFKICPECENVLEIKIDNRGQMRFENCKRCNNTISRKTIPTEAEKQSRAQGIKMVGNIYGNMVKNNINNITKDD